MAEEDYRRLTCGACNAVFTQLSKGRPAKTCEPCRSGPERRCARCDSRLGKGKLKWCSSVCQYGAKMTREQYRESVRGNAKGAFTCRCCGVESYRGLSSTNKKRGTGNVFCSMGCKVAHAAKVRIEVESIRKMGKTSIADRRIKLNSVSALARVLEKVRRIKDRATAACLICGGPCGGGKTSPRKYCSDACKAKTEWAKAAKRRHHARRRAIERGDKHAKSIDPIKVLERDGWKCQICMRPTPKSLRGTYKDNAPELDHIVPLARGGRHEWSNLQCACRACNSKKGYGPPLGQIGLFSSLV
jgi:5-methylcytosine-specific restriction endonuclease McrA